MCKFRRVALCIDRKFERSSRAKCQPRKSVVVNLSNLRGSRIDMNDCGSLCRMPSSESVASSRSRRVSEWWRRCLSHVMPFLDRGLGLWTALMTKTAVWNIHGQRLASIAREALVLRSCRVTGMVFAANLPGLMWCSPRSSGCRSRYDRSIGF